MSKTAKKTIPLRLHPDVSEASRKFLMQNLDIGESLVFLCEPGQTAHRLQASITSNWRGLESMKQQGLEQQRGMLVFEGETTLAVVRVTRVSEPEEIE